MTYRHVRRAVLSGLAVLAVVVAGLTAGAAPALADGCSSASCAGSGGGGYTVTATVRFSGDAAPGGGGSVSIGVPATCWWSPESQTGITPELQFDNPSTWLAWYDNAFKGTNGTFAFAREYLGDRAMWEAAVKRAEGGEKLGVYTATCRSGAPKCAQIDFVGGKEMNGPLGVDCGLAPLYNFYAAGNVPPPLVDPADLARIARDRMDIPAPQIDRNPKVGSLGQATLVTLPTWFWVTNPAAVGGTDGTRTIRADVGPVWAQVVAKTNGLTITSPAGGTSCPPAQASQAYTAGASDASGCTVSFERASVAYAGGYPVDASTAWSASWTGQTGGGAAVGGDLPGLARETTVTVPVAESQALVNNR